jgi:hypothetical protein
VYTAEGRKRKTLYGKTRNEVSGKLTKAMSDRDGGLRFDAGKMTLGEYLDRWLVDSARGTVRTASPTGSTLSIPHSLRSRRPHRDASRRAPRPQRPPQIRSGTLRTRQHHAHLLHLLPRLARHGRRRCLRHGSSVVQMLDLFAPEVSTPDSSLLYRPRCPCLGAPRARWRQTSVTSKMHQIRVRGMSISAGEERAFEHCRSRTRGAGGVDVHTESVRVMLQFFSRVPGPKL